METHRDRSKEHRTTPGRFTPERLAPESSNAAVPVDPAETQGICACIVGQSNVRLWGLTSRQRLRRLFARAGVTRFVEEGADSYPNGSIVFVRSDRLYDERAILSLVNSEMILEVKEDGQSTVVAAHVPSSLAAQALARLRGNGPSTDLPGVPVETPETLTSVYLRRLRKLEPLVILPIGANQSTRLERYLFDGSYKGVTDLVTKWVWPTPARWATHLCTRLGLLPNHVTLLGSILVVAVLLLFGEGWYGLGLGLAWLMTFLDTVDGKLARVTVHSTPVGHVLDHGTDLLHPPFWYLAWGYGLSTYAIGIPGLTLDVTLLAILIGYIVGRLVEIAFRRRLGSFGLFCWRPIDSYFRLVTARRNPNLVLLTAGLLLGRPDWGLLAVAAWTVASSVFLVARLLMATHSRVTSGPLHSWLTEKHTISESLPRYARPFVPPAALPAQPLA